MRAATLGILAVYALLIGYVRYAIWRDGRRREREELEAEARRWSEAARVRRARHRKSLMRLRIRQLKGGNTAA